MWVRLALSCGILMGTLLLLPQFDVPDFAQDYAAARGWWDGRDPNDPTDQLLADCCPELARSYPMMQTAHPPFATLLTLPFALLPWPAARFSWLFISWIMLTMAWHIGKIPPMICAVTACFWFIALVLGTHEPFLFVLLIGALLLEPHKPLWAGWLVGLAIVIKVYPLLVLVSLWLGGRRNVAVAAIGSSLAITAITEFILGFGVTLHWLAYMPLNTQRYVDDIGNGSLVRLVRELIPGVSSTFTALIIFGILILPLLPRFRRGEWLRPLMPVILLVSPLSWRHYMGLIALTPLGRVEQICLAVSGIVAILVGMDLVPPDNLALIVQGPLLLVLVLLWYKMSRSERRSHIRAQSKTER